MLRFVADEVLGVGAGSVTRVAVDGVDGAGKTTFANELADALAEGGRAVIRVSADDFLNPRSVRHARGRTRDFLLEHSDEAARYAALKRQLVKRYPQDRLAYIAGKEQYVTDLEARAIVWARRLPYGGDSTPRNAPPLLSPGGSGLVELVLPVWRKQIFATGVALSLGGRRASAPRARTRTPTRTAGVVAERAGHERKPHHEQCLQRPEAADEVGEEDGDIGREQPAEPPSPVTRCGHTKREAE